MKRFKIKIQGTTPLLQHRMPEDELFALLGTKSERKVDKEVKTPREIAERYVYHTEGGYAVPTEYVVGAFKTVASEYKQKNSVRKSLKAIAGGIFSPENEFCLLVDEKGSALKKFEVDIRKATNHQKGAVAVCRPRFDRWHFEMTANIDDALVSPEVVLAMLNDAGKRSGIGSYRVARGGRFGQFVVTEFTELKK